MPANQDSEYNYQAEIYKFNSIFKTMYNQMTYWENVISKETGDVDSLINEMNGRLNEIILLTDKLPTSDVGFKYLFFITPIKVAGQDHLMSLVHIPEMDTAMTLGTGHWYIGISKQVTNLDYNSKKDFDTKDGFPDLNDERVLSQVGSTLPSNFYHKQIGEVISTKIRFEYGINDLMDAGIKVGYLSFTPLTMYDFEGNKNYTVLQNANQGLEDLVLSLKWNVLKSQDRSNQLAVKGEFKYPLGEPTNMLSSGSEDYSITGLYTNKYKSLYTNINYGISVLGELDKPFARSINTQKFINYFGIGECLQINNSLGLMAMYQQYESPYSFKGLDYLSNDIKRVGVGTKIKWGSVMSEINYIKGLSEGSAKDTGVINIYFEP